MCCINRTSCGENHPVIQQSLILFILDEDYKDLAKYNKTLQESTANSRCQNAKRFYNENADMQTFVAIKLTIFTIVIENLC